MDKKCLVSKGPGACKNSGSSSSHPSFVSLNGGPEFGFLYEGTSVREMLPPAGEPQTPLKEWLWVRDRNTGCFLPTVKRKAFL